MNKEEDKKKDKKKNPITKERIVMAIMIVMGIAMVLAVIKYPGQLQPTTLTYPQQDSWECIKYESNNSVLVYSSTPREGFFMLTDSKINITEQQYNKISIMDKKDLISQGFRCTKEMMIRNN